MIFKVLLLAVGAYGAALPPQPLVPTQSACLNKCFDNGNIVAAANDLKNFKSMAVDIENFCQINAEVLKCGGECSEQDIVELKVRTAASNYACSQKIEEFRLVHDCLAKSEEEEVAVCLNQCGLGQSGQETDAFRLDSAASSPLNPTALIDAIAPTCKNHLCVVQCATRTLNQKCAGAGDIFKDIARNQIERGSARLQSEMNDVNNTMVQNIAENYWEKLPNECAFLKDIDVFNLLTVIDENASTSAATVPTKLEVTEKAILSNMDAELVAKTSPKPTSEIPEAVTEESAEMESEKEHKEGDEFAANADASSSHVFTPEDDFVPFGSPANATSEEVTESPSVALPEEDVKLANQGTISPVDVEQADEEKEKAEEADTEESSEKSTSEVRKDLPAVSTTESTEDKEETTDAEEMKEDKTNVEFADSTDEEVTTQQKNMDFTPTTEGAKSEETEESESTPKMSEIKEEAENEEKEITDEASVAHADDADHGEHEENQEKMEEAVKHAEEESTTEQIIVVNDDATNTEEIVKNAVVTSAPEMEMSSSAKCLSIAMSIVMAALVL